MCMSIIIPAAASEADVTIDMYETETLSIDELISRDLGESYSERGNDCEAVREDLQIVEDYFGLQNVYIHTGEEGTEFVYEKQYSEKYTDFIKVTQNGEAVTFDITEDDCHNTLCMLPDGTIILDGNEVIITTSLGENTDAGIAPASIYTTTHSDVPFPGTQAYQYSNLLDTYEKVAINAHSFIKNLAVSTISGLIGSAIASFIGAPAVGGVIGTLLGAIAPEIKDIAERQAPDSAYLSCILYKYAHSSNTIYDRYFRYLGHYYAKRDFQGDYATTSLYERMVMN